MNVKLILKIFTIALVVLCLVGAGAYGWASVTSASLLSRTFQTHAIEVPVPFPLTVGELSELGIEQDLGNEIALVRARERGQHLVEARYGCVECHGQDFSGGVMLDAFPLGTLLGPNITTGEGSVTVGYTARDWDRIVRHGVKPDGTPAAMPSEDFQLMSDQELSDIIAYVRSRPPMFGEVAPVRLGPLGKFLLATRQLPLSADLIGSHDVAHAAYPPETEVSAEFGRHLAGVCTGCHRQDLSGGPIAAGDGSKSHAARRRLGGMDVRGVRRVDDDGGAPRRDGARRADDADAPLRAQHDGCRDGGSLDVSPVASVRPDAAVTHVGRQVRRRCPPIWPSLSQDPQRTSDVLSPAENI